MDLLVHTDVSEEHAAYILSCDNSIGVTNQRTNFDILTAARTSEALGLFLFCLRRCVYLQFDV